MNYKGHKITLEKVVGYVWSIEKPDGSTVSEVSTNQNPTLHDERKTAVEEAIKVVDILRSPEPPTK